MRFTKFNISAPFGDQLRIFNVSRVTALPFQEVCAPNAPAVQKLSNGVEIVALSPSVEEISMPEIRDFTADSILEDVKVDLTSCHIDSWWPKRAKIFYTQEHCKAVTLRPNRANLVNDWYVVCCGGISLHLVL